MKIRRLEIIGFKSFVDKVSLEFPDGITGVVGPNGCGKSNIVDAIRWVIGEQSAKNLRGRSMEDVIFGGSESRKPLGMAEVSIVFSMEDGRVPVKYMNYSEVQVTRRYFRDGDSEYLMNKTPCRLLDITELFMDTGIGAKAYSVIEQGKIGMILHAKPEERRFLIEEAAGVTKFKSRKKVALKKIEVTRQNLLRLSDIISEIKRQLSALQRQAKKAERFREYREELKEIELLFAAVRIIALQEELEQAVGELSSLNEHAALLSSEMENGELALEESRLLLLEEEKSVTFGQEDIYRLKGDIQALENRQLLHRKELENLERLRERYEGEMETLKRQLADAESEKKSLEEHKGGFLVEAGEEEERLIAAEKRVEEMTAMERALAARLEESRKSLFALLTDIARLSNQHAAAAKRLAGLDERFERSRREAVTLGERLAESAALVAGLEAELALVTEGKGALQEEGAALRQEEEELRLTLSSLEKEFQGERDKLSRNSSRLQSLRELESSFEGYGKGVRTILTTERFKGRFRGVVADLLETAEEHETALEAVLADRLQHVLSDGTVSVLEALSYLKETNGGRGSFILPLEGVEEPSQELAGATPFISLVAFSHDAGGFLLHLLRHAYLVETMEAALSHAANHPFLTFVTPDGDLVSQGTITGGPMEGVEHGLIHKKREIKELSILVGELSARVAELEARREARKGRLSMVEERGKELRHELHQEELRLVNVQKDLQRAGDERRRVEERIAVKGMEEEQLAEERTLLEGEINGSAAGVAAIEDRKVSQEMETASLQSELADRRHELDDAREAVTVLKVRTASLRERRDSNLRAISRVDNLVKDLQGRVEGRASELAGGEAEHGRLNGVIASISGELQGLLVKAAEAESAFVAMKERYEAKAAQVREAEARLKGVRSACEEAKNSAGVKNLRVSELSMGLNHLKGSVEEKYRIPVDDLLPRFMDVEFDEAMKRQRREELEGLIEGLGEVNLLAIDEYKELETRHDFLASQQADLQESLDALQQAIQKINRTTRKRFHETFHQVNDKFREVFPRLFCGGKGELRLTDEEDLLECGIEIVVQPPGKKLQNVTLLSGGEKALTAVALIFSIFLIKPTPFCLLDEVDAPLDDANIGRFNDMVREMSGESQFIIITHNRNTMSVADTLYGVTMEEAGVSKTVSVRLN